MYRKIIIVFALLLPFRTQAECSYLTEAANSSLDNTAVKQSPEKSLFLLYLLAQTGNFFVSLAHPEATEMLKLGRAIESVGKGTYLENRHFLRFLNAVDVRIYDYTGVLLPEERIASSVAMILNNGSKSDLFCPIVKVNKVTNRQYMKYDDVVNLITKQIITETGLSYKTIIDWPNKRRW